jgi:hypothetical protein
MPRCTHTITHSLCEPWINLVKYKVLLTTGLRSGKDFELFKLALMQRKVSYFSTVLHYVVFQYGIGLELFCFILALWHCQQRYKSMRSITFPPESVFRAQLANLCVRIWFVIMLLGCSETFSIQIPLIAFRFCWLIIRMGRYRMHFIERIIIKSIGIYFTICFELLNWQKCGWKA